MFDIAWSELALIGAVALIVIGPKDLPRVMRNLGQWTRRARMMAAEFQRNLDEMMREAELDELKREVNNISPAGFKAKVEDLIDVKGMEEAMRVTPEPAVVSDDSAPPSLSAGTDEPPVTAPADPITLTASSEPPAITEVRDPKGTVTEPKA